MVSETTTRHTCGGPAWGRLTDGCPRCEELRSGAPARRQTWRESYRQTPEMPMRDRYCFCSSTPLGAQVCPICGLPPYCD